MVLVRPVWEGSEVRWSGSASRAVPPGLSQPQGLSSQCGGRGAAASLLLFRLIGILLREELWAFLASWCLKLVY